MFYNNLSKTCTCHVTDCKHVMYVIPSGIPPDRDEMEYIQPNILIFYYSSRILDYFHMERSESHTHLQLI